jgi:general secretion pathway protein H
MGRKAAKALMPISETGISATDLNPRLGRAMRGFTLLELLVVVVIIGVLAGSLVFSARDITGNVRRLEQEAFRLRGLIGLLREEALLQTRDYGIVFAESGYRFYVFDYTQFAWVPPANEQLFVDHAVPEGISVELRLEGRDLTLEEDFDVAAEEDAAAEPQVLILATGELTPFTAGFYTDFNGGRFLLTAAIDGTLEVSREGFDAP